MEVEFLKEADAPQPPKPVSKTAAEILAIINGLKQGQVAKITPPEGKSIRGLKTSFGRVASGQGVKIQTWSVEGDDSLYVKRVQK